MAEKKNKKLNRLINEKSPYLRQHAHDLVDWNPWTEEAFEKARKEDKPVFLSIGYSTCHWCHVMGEESFSDPQLSEIMNERYIPVIVDREERPDLDNLYMKAVLAMSGNSGWPLNLFLTGEKKPFYGGTYFPPEDKWGKPGLKKILASFSELWKSDREELLNNALMVVNEIVKRKHYEKEGLPLDEGIFRKAYQRLFSRFDQRFGGFGNGPKFPRPHILSFLLRYWDRTHENKAMEVVEKTLMKMAKGGLCDQIGGGFYRYSVDKQWKIPHFEKMLYDQALLSKVYLEAYQATHIKVYGDIAKGILDYVLRDIRNPDGGFFTGEDADSALNFEDLEKKKEGAFYLFSKDEIIAVLGKEYGEIIQYHFGFDQPEGALIPMDKDLRGKHILYIAHNVQDTARHFNRNSHEIDHLLSRAKKKLFAFRLQRPRPHLDNKILVDWNGLMISSLSLGARIFDEPRYREEAEKAACFILKNLLDERGRLLHRYCDGEAAIDGMIDDYAFFIQGLVDLYETTFDLEYIKKAKDLLDVMIELFWDEEEKGFFFISKDVPPLFIRQKEIYDGSIPSGNSIAALNLLRLARILTNKEIENKSESLFKAFSNQVSQVPEEYCQLLIALSYALGPAMEIVLAGNKKEEQFKAMVFSCYQRLMPNTIIIHRPAAGKELAEVLNFIPLVKNQPPIENQPTAYVCKNSVCKSPARNLEKLNELLSEG